MAMSENGKTLFLLDAYALIYRAHFAFSKNPRITSKGQNTGVMFGFTNSLLEVLQKREPSHIAVAFDMSGPTFRHEVFEDYKANRQETPEDVRAGIPVVKEIVKAFNIPVLEMQGYEADDIIGTIAKKASTKGYTVFMMTPDKDFGQIVEDNIFLYKPAYMGNAVDILGPEEVKEKWGIENVDQVRDMLGLQGDASDNIPGIPGVGPKTARKYIQEYKTVENLVAHAHELKGKQKENVEEFGQQGILSKELATIDVNVPVEFDEKAFEYKAPDEKKLREIFEELEFRTLIQRVFSSGSETAAKVRPAPEQSQLDLFGGGSGASTHQVSENIEQDADETVLEKTDFFSVKHFQHIVQSPSKLEQLSKYLTKQKEVAISFESEGNSVDAEIKGIGLSYYEEESFFIPLKGTPQEIRKYLDPLKSFFANKNIILIGHDLKPDLIVLQKYGIKIACKLYDIMLAHYILDPETRHSLDVLSENYSGYSLLTKDTKAAVEELQNRAGIVGEKAEVILKLKSVFAEEIRKADMNALLDEVEMPLLEVLQEMEYEGVRLDADVLKEISKELEGDIIKSQEEVYHQAGEEFNISSPKQLGVILFEKMNLLEKPKKTKSGQYATGEEILTKLAAEHDIVKSILDYREFQKLKNTYVDALPALISPFDYRLHTTYSQAVAATGRLSSVNPNLQNIPIRTARGREIRKAFISRDSDHVLISADYSQIELRIMASFSGDEQMIEAFKNGRDIHTTTASKVFKVKEENVDDDMRRKAKSANFGIIYGISAFGLGQNLNIPRKEAVEIIEAYFAEFPAVKRYMDRVINEAREKGYVTTLLGRKRYLRDITSRNVTMRGYAERNAINAPIQGSAADMIKLAMIKIHNWIKENDLKSKMVLQVHDELIFDTHKSEVDLLKEKVPYFMKNALTLDVPLEVGIGTGDNWLDAH
jgi:DNA polymerase-1